METICNSGCSETNSKLMRKYRISFEIWGLLLFLLIMIPNFIWLAIPAPQDILRNESITAPIDAIASVCQIILIAALCAIVNTEREALRLTPLVLGSIACGLLYYTGWILYYLGFTKPVVILLLTVPPCLAFLFFAIDRKNFAAVIPIVIFSVCHLIYGVANFILH